MTARRVLHRAALLAFHVLVVRPVLRVIVGVRYRRRSLVPQAACLVVANHNSHLDAPVLLSLFPLRRLPYVHPVAAADYFGETWLRRTMALVLMNAIPIRRSPGAGQDPLAHVVETLQAGGSIILFPEGTRGEAGVVALFRSGVGRIVRALPDLTVVPVFLHGPERIWPRGEVVPVPLGIDVHVGKPRSYDPSREAREIAEEIRADVLALAPPPAPAPGTRPAPPSLVAVCGGTEGARRDVVLEVTERLGRSEGSLALGLVDFPVEADKEGLRDSDLPPVRRRRGHALLARLVGTGPPYDGVRFADLVKRAKLEQSLASDFEARFAVLAGSALVDLLASAPSADDRETYQRMLYAEASRRVPLAHWFRTLRGDPVLFLLNALSLARLRAPALLVLMAPDDAYRRVGEMLRRTRKTELLELEEATQPAAIVEAVVAACRRLDAGAAPRSSASLLPSGESAS